MIGSVVRGLAQGITPNKGGGFSLAAFMAAQSDGFWYDFSQTDRLFQDPNGPTPADEPNEVIGLALSSRLWGGKTLAAYLAEQPELLANGGFDSAANWTIGASGGWAITGGRAELTGDGTAQNIYQYNVFTLGKTYLVSFDVYASAFTIGFENAAAQIVAGGASGRVSAIWTADRTQLSFKRSGGTINGWIDNVSIKEVPRYAATQATTSFKPKFQTTGAAFDGTDDYLRSAYTLGPAGNFVVAKIDAPPVIAATQVVVGANTTTEDYFLFGLATTGQLRLGTGSSLSNVGQDVRGQTVVVGISFQGGVRRIFLSDGTLVESAYAGTPATALPLFLGSRNTNGTPTNFYGGSIKSIVAGRQFLDLATFKQIAASL